MSTPLPDNVAPFTMAELLSATGGRLAAGPGDVVVRGVSTDTRQLAAGNLFVALVGERFDGHDHVDQVDAASAVLVSREVEAPDGVAVVEVDDTLIGLGALAAAHRARFSLPVVAVTGSVGKTTTKELIATALNGVGRRVLATRGNLNNRIGTPLTLLTLDETHEVAVVEIGMSIPGEIARLAAMVRPTVGLVTAVAVAHTEGVGSVDGVAREKGALLEALDASGTAVAPSDDDAIAPYLAESAAGRRFAFGGTDDADVRVVGWDVLADGRSMVTLLVDGSSTTFSLALLGPGHARNVAATIAVGLALGESVESMVDALADVSPVPGRLEPRVAPGDVLVLDDSYNASPRSVAVALETGAALAKARGGRLHAVLGDMLELGASSRELHREVGDRVVEARTSSFIAVGEEMAEAGRTAEFAGVVVHAIADAAEAEEWLRPRLEARDVVLVKGSRGTRTERVVDALLRVGEEGA